MLIVVLYSPKGRKGKNPFLDDECEDSGDASSDSHVASSGETTLWVV